MRSVEPQPGNPWPHDMQISIDEPSSLTYLLFVRAAWRLPVADVPSLDPHPSVGESRMPPSVDLDDATSRWRREWARAWEPFEQRRAIREPDEEMMRLLELPDDQLIEAVSVASSAFWSEGVDRSAFDAWQRSLRDDHLLPLEQHPERVCLDALIPAWRAGLLKIIQLPYLGDFAERIDRSTLVVSRTTRFDATLYGKALGVIGSETS